VSRVAGAAREDRKQKLVEAAYGRLAERGFEGLRTREVAAAAGVNVATLHYYFPTKESLIRGTVEHALQRFRSTLEPHGSPADQLRNHLRAVQRLLAEEPELSAVMAELALRSARDPVLAEILRETNATWQKTLRGLLRRAVREGHLDPGLDSDDVAALILATLTSLTIPSVASPVRARQAIRQLERWLGTTPKKGMVQATD
jgi:AcrR family transcriptional regulator